LHKLLGLGLTKIRGLPGFCRDLTSGKGSCLKSSHRTKQRARLQKNATNPAVTIAFMPVAASLLFAISKPSKGGNHMKNVAKIATDKY
jgi:hypothetical protein